MWQTATSSEAEELRPPPIGTVEWATASTPAGACPRTFNTRDTPLT